MCRARLVVVHRGIATMARVLEWHLICNVADTPKWSKYENGDPGTGSVSSTHAWVATSVGNGAAGASGGPVVRGHGKGFHRSAFLSPRVHGCRGVRQQRMCLGVSQQ
jgi:hypothetical protein